MKNDPSRNSLRSDEDLKTQQNATIRNIGFPSVVLAADTKSTITDNKTELKKDATASELHFKNSNKR